jgi:hypothetical protein
MEENKEKIELRPGFKGKCEINGWYVLDELLNKVYLKNEPAFYKEIFKKYNDVKVLAESHSEEAKHLIWQNTDEKNIQQNGKR